MVVKIQQSLFNSECKMMMLIYNKSRSFVYESELTNEVEKSLNNRKKAYFEIRLIDEKINILREVKTQDW